MVKDISIIAMIGNKPEKLSGLLKNLSSCSTISRFELIIGVSANYKEHITIPSNLTRNIQIYISTFVNEYESHLFLKNALNTLSFRHVAFFDHNFVHTFDSLDEAIKLYSECNNKTVQFRISNHNMVNTLHTRPYRIDYDTVNHSAVSEFIASLYFKKLASNNNFSFILISDKEVLENDCQESLKYSGSDLKILSPLCLKPSPKESSNKLAIAKHLNTSNPAVSALKIDNQSIKKHGNKAITNKNWAKAVQYWNAVFMTSNGKVEANTYISLGRSYRMTANVKLAEKILQQGKRRYPENTQILIELAICASAQRLWNIASNYWQELVKTMGREVPQNRLLSLVRSYRMSRNFDAAEKEIQTILGGYYKKIDKTIDFENELAEIAIGKRQSLIAVKQWRKIIDTYEEQVPEGVYIRLSNAYISLQDFVSAKSITSKAMARFPESFGLTKHLSFIAMQQWNWSEVIKTSHLVFDRYDDPRNSIIYQRMGIAYRFIGDYTKARETITKGIEKHPGNADLTYANFELAMVDRNWPVAVDRLICLLNISNAHKNNNYKLPLTRNVEDWFEGYWKDFANYIIGISPNKNNFSDSLYIKTAEVLHVLCFSNDAESLIRVGLYNYPDHLKLLTLMAEISMQQKDWQEAIKRWQNVIAAQGDKIPYIVYYKFHLCCKNYNEKLVLPEYSQNNINSRSGMMRAYINKNHRIFFKPKINQDCRNTIKFELIRYAPESLLEEQIENGIHVTKNNISKFILNLSGDKTGPYDNAQLNPFIKKLARRLSYRAAQKYPREYISGDSLADALYYHIERELQTLIPMKYLARALYKLYGEQPVFIELPKRQIPLLESFFSDIEPFMLYYELVRCGGKPFLSLKESFEVTDGQKVNLDFLPGNLWMRKVPNSPKSQSKDSSLAICPDGIRGFDTFFANYKDDHIFNGVFLSRLLTHSEKYSKTNLEFSSTLFKDALLPKKFNILFNFLTSLKNVNFTGEPATGELWTSDITNTNLIHWLDYILGVVIDNLAKNAQEYCESNNIKELYICDHMFVESAIMTDAVVKNGGQITLWPHSTNPVDHPLRPSKIIKKIYCVTKSGLKTWKNHYRDKDIEILPEIMLPNPSKVKLSRQNMEKHLSVIIIGGASIMSRIPLGPLSKHYKSYRDFYNGLQEIDNVDIYFRGKGKGTQLDSYLWFQQNITDTVTWSPAYDHPLEMNYPNMIFVCITQHSSALLEGMARGIPAMLVRDFDISFRHDIDTTVVPAGSTEYILQEIRKSINFDYRTNLAQKQMDYYLNEILN